MKTNTNISYILTLMHTAVIHLWIVLATLAFGLTAIVFSFFSKTGNSVHRVARYWAKTILWVSGIRVDIKGSLDANSAGSFILMSNHQSNYDVPVLLGSLPIQFRWLAKAELFRIPIFGASMSGAGYISIDRSNRQSAFQSLARAAQLIRNGTSVMIFPEGTRSLKGDLLPFKKGGFVMAVDAGVPIIPIIIKGTHEIMPKKSLVISRRSVNLEILQPIATAGYTRNTKDELMVAVHNAMTTAKNNVTPGGQHA